jgi:hypothetical protein
LTSGAESHGVVADVAVVEFLQDGSGAQTPDDYRLTEAPRGKKATVGVECL